jgi:hypothetical protein
MFNRVEADRPQRALKLGEALVGRRINAKSQPAPFGDGMQGRVLQKL